MVSAPYPLMVSLSNHGVNKTGANNHSPLHFAHGSTALKGE